MSARLSPNFATVSMTVPALFVLLTIAGCSSSPVGQQTESSYRQRAEIQQERTKEGLYQVDVAWSLTKDGKGVEIQEISEQVTGEAGLFRDRGTPLRIHAESVSPESIRFEVEQMPLNVKDEHPFSVVAVGVDGVGTPAGSNIQVNEVTAKTVPLDARHQVLLLDWNITQLIPPGTTSGTFKVTHICETCPENPCTLGLD